MGGYVIGYRTLASTETPGSNEKMLNAIEDWLRYKKGFADPSAVDQNINNDAGAVLRHQHHIFDDGTEALRWSFTEQWPKQQGLDGNVDRMAQIQITVTSDGQRVSLLADIHPPMEEHRYGSRPRYVGTPGFINKILESVALYDGQTALTLLPSYAESADSLDVLLNAIRDDSRQGMVLVTAPPNGSTAAEWLDALKDVLNGLHGLASIHMVAPKKLDAFNEWAGAAHSLAPGSIRTYKPGADFDNPLDGYIHRTMHHHRIIGRDSGKKLNRILCRSLVTELSTALLPSALRQAEIEFRRPARLRQASADHGSSVDVSVFRDEIKELTELLEVSDKENDSLRAQAEEAEKNIRELAEDNDFLTLEVSSQHDKLDQLIADKRVLQRQLFGLTNDHRSLVVSAPANEMPTSPETFEDLVKRIEEISGVLWCGDPGVTEELDEYTDLGASVVLKTWEVLLTFNAYVEARTDGSFDGGLIQYQRNHETHGKYMRITKLSPRESNTVQQNQKMRDQRTFDVPKTIDPSGKRTMFAHVPLATGRGRSPRLYFEDTWTTNGRVTIGYIGAHLDNKSTN